MRFAFADPPYPGMAHLYKDHPDYAGEVDHARLIERLVAEYPDGWALSTNMRDLATLLPLCPPATRVLAWCKPDAMPQDHRAELMWSWEPVLIRPGRRPAIWVRDYLVCAKGQPHFIGAKPPVFALWLFRCLGALPGDTLDDLFPGSRAVSRAWDEYQRQLALPFDGERPTQRRLAEGS